MAGAKACATVRSDDTFHSFRHASAAAGTYGGVNADGGVGAGERRQQRRQQRLRGGVHLPHCRQLSRQVQHLDQVLHAVQIEKGVCLVRSGKPRDVGCWTFGKSSMSVARSVTAPAT